jgi:uncharacterized 2Fe-2S/4Fe-4S cluster protein (DUF4445 family)
LLAVEKGDTTRACYGAAFDLGTTTIVGTLMDLNNGEPKAVASQLNAQASPGGDVLSRISHTMGRAQGLAELQQLAATTINQLLEQLAARAGAAGSTDHRRRQRHRDPPAARSTRSRSRSPFIPAIGGGSAGRGSVSPSIGGRVCLFLPSAPTSAATSWLAFATALPRGDRLRLFVDVGTNGEIALGSEPRTVATAAPAGPAFEGAEISCGMRATTGAIEGVTITADDVTLQTIEDARPVGLCGSGLIDAVAQLYRRGLMDATGRMLGQDDLRGKIPPSLLSRVVTVDGVRAFVLATEEQTGGRRILFSQKDVRQLQFAKGSIAAGIRVLMKVMGVKPEALQEILLAGAFGSYINPDSARTIGLVPAVPLDRIRAIGNAAGEGAKIGLLSYSEREAADAMPGARRVHTNCPVART